MKRITLSIILCLCAVIGMQAQNADCQGKHADEINTRVEELLHNYRN